MALPQGIGPGARLGLSLDQGRRRDHSEQHSGQHLLSAACLRILGAPTKSFHLGPESSTIDLACALPADEELREIEARVNEQIGEDYSIHTHLCPPEDIASFPLRRLPPAGEEVLRVVEIDGLDYTPCCGTHLASTGELRLLLLLGAEKYKSMTRVSFLFGSRALNEALLATRAAREATRVLGVGPSLLAEEVTKVLGRAKKCQAEKRALVRARAVLEAKEALLAAGAAGKAGLPILLSFPGRDAEAAMEGAKALSELGATALVVSQDETTVCTSCPETGPDLATLLGPLAAAMGGRGGGRGTFFRASFPNAANLGEFLAESMKILQN